MFLCFERVAFSSGRGFFFRCASFLKDTLCSYKSFFLCDQVLCSALASLPPCLLEIFTHKSGWHPKIPPTTEKRASSVSSQLFIGLPFAGRAFNFPKGVICQCA